MSSGRWNGPLHEPEDLAVRAAGHGFGLVVFDVFRPTTRRSCNPSSPGW
jgi:hypothetical protein